MLNVLILSELFYPHGSGSELATYLYAELLRKAGINVTVITNKFTGESDVSKSENLIVYRLPLFNETRRVKYSILRRVDILISSFMRKQMKWADVVYVPRFWFSAIPLAKAMGKPVIVHLHDYIPICPLAVLYNSRRDGVCEKDGFCSAGCVYAYESSKRSLVRTCGSTFLNLTVWPILKRFVECSDAIVCVSTAQRDLLVRHAPSLGEKVKVIYNPLPSLPLMEVAGDGFGYFGGPSYPRGFHVLLKALVYRKLRGLNPVIVYAMKFSPFDERVTASLRELGFVLHGKLGGEELDRIYQKIKAVVVPSMVPETFGYVVAEALLRGRLVIASRIGGILELVEGCKGVFLFNAGDVVQLAERIEYVSSLSMENVADLGSSNRELLLKRFSNEKTLQSFLNLCNKVVNNH